jgi:6-phosphogluconolactonase (cycloisomerase 2 family)
LNQVKVTLDIFTDLSSMSSHRLLLGTYTSTVHLVEFTPPTTSQAPTLRLIKDLPIPRASWITKHPKLNDIWYIAHEVDDDGGRAAGVEGFIWVYRITSGGFAEKLGEVSAVDNPCHVEVVAGGTGLAAACVSRVLQSRKSVDCVQFSTGSAILISLNEDGTFKQADNNYIKLPASDPGTETAKCHQCIDVPSRQECWMVDTGNACLQRMKITKNKDDTLAWKLSDRLNVLPGQGPRQAVLSPDGKSIPRSVAKIRSTRVHPTCEKLLGFSSPTVGDERKSASVYSQYPTP